MIAVKNHHNGTLDPYTHFNFEITVEQALNAPIISWPLGLFDSCPTTDGAAAILLARQDRAKEYTDQPLYFLGTGLATDPLFLPWKKNFIEFPATQEAAKVAYEMAGIGPDDIDLAELHDCFTITELLTYEDMGFCKKGEGGKWIEEGHPTLNGTKPCNPSGGLKAKGHPIGATGVAQVCELWWHLRGEAEERQVKDAQIGCTHNLGGLGTVVLVNIFGKEPR